MAEIQAESREGEVRNMAACPSGERGVHCASSCENQYTVRGTKTKSRNIQSYTTGFWFLPGQRLYDTRYPGTWYAQILCCTR